MKSNRHRAREIAFQILYRYDLESQASSLPMPKDYALGQDLKRHFEHFQVQENLRAFAEDLVKGTMAQMQTLDATIEAHAQNWKVARMPFVDRNVLRMAAYEMRTHRDIAPSITINEAIELVKEFGTAESAAFVNGILDSISKSNAGNEGP